MKTSKPYKARSLKGAEAMVRNHRKQIADLNAILERWAKERGMLAKLAAGTVQFFNPIDMIEAEKIRDSILNPSNRG